MFIKNTTRSKLTDNIDVIKIWIWRIILVLSFVEILVYPELENIYGCFCFIYAWAIVNKFVFVRKYLYSTFFIPVFCIFGYAFCYYFLALPMTLVEGKPLTFNFQVPFLTWTNQIFHISIIVLAFKACVFFYSRKNLLHRFWKNIGYLNPPTEKQIWALAFLGCVAMFCSMSRQGTENATMDNFAGFIINTIKTFAYFPICLLFPSLYKKDSSGTKINKKIILIYVIFLFVVAIGTTRRTLMFGAVVAIGFAYIAYMLLKNVKLLNKKNTFFIILGFYLLTGPVADLSMAMILNRQISGESSASNTFRKVMDLYKNKEMLHHLYQNSQYMADNGGDNMEGWSEYYLDNVFLDRFCNVRVIDVTLYYAQRIGYGNSQMMNTYLDQFLVRLIPSAFVGYEKKQIITSPGDMLSSESLGETHLGWRVAGDTGTGLSLWGYYYYIICFIILFVLFYFFSSQVTCNGVYLFIPIPILSSLMRYFMYFGNDYGIFKTIKLLVREGWEAIIIYSIVYYIVRKLVK